MRKAPNVGNFKKPKVFCGRDTNFYFFNFFNSYCKDSDVDEKMSFPGILHHFESALPVDRMLVGKAHHQLERFSIWGDIETSSTPLTNILLLLMEQNFWFNTGVFQKSSKQLRWDGCPDESDNDFLKMKFAQMIIQQRSLFWHCHWLVC